MGAPHPSAMDGRSVDEFIDQVPKPLKTRNLGKDDQVDFILSPSGVPHLKRSVYVPRETYSVFSEKPSIAQLLGTFHSHPQLEGEDFFEYLHTLTQIFHSSLKQKPDTVSDAKMAAREQFVEGIRSSAQ